MRCTTAAVIAAAAALGCGGGLTLPESSGAGLDLSSVDGNEQIGTVGSALPDPLVVRVVTEGAGPAAGRRVAFVPVGGAGAGSMDPDTAVTNSRGEAFSIWVLGTTPGDYQAEARLVADAEQPSPVLFTASARAGAPDTLRAASPVNRAGRRGAALSEPLVVHVSDRYGNPVAGARVEWDVIAGKGELSESDSETDADGNTQVIWTMGEQIGLQRATASIADVHGSPVTFTATVLF